MARGAAEPAVSLGRAARGRSDQVRDCRQDAPACPPLLARDGRGFARQGSDRDEVRLVDSPVAGRRAGSLRGADARDRAEAPVAPGGPRPQPAAAISVALKASSVRLRALSFFMTLRICTLTVLSHMLSS